jgi:hypothetical protein
MRGARAWRLVGLAGVVVAVAMLAAGCGDDDTGGDGGGRDAGNEAPASPEAVEAADMVCTMLRTWNNDLGDVINATSQTITDEDDPSTAKGVLVGGFDEMIGLARQHRRQVDQLQLPAVDERDELVHELAEGADESIDVLREERQEAADLGPIDVDEQRSALGGAFTGVERALSVIEPEIERYDEDLRRAFEADEGCMHVIQPF